MTDYTELDSFFTVTDDIMRGEMIYQWGQTNLLPLNGKELERVAADLVQYFMKNLDKMPENNLVIPEVYWAGDTKFSHHHLNYALKEWLMMQVVYHECSYIHFEANKIIWEFENKAPRFVARDITDKKANPHRKIKGSGYTLEQKDILWAGIGVGYLDVPEVRAKPVKKSRKAMAEEAVENDYAETQAESVAVQETFVSKEKPVQPAKKTTIKKAVAKKTPASEDTAAKKTIRQAQKASDLPTNEELNHAEDLAVSEMAIEQSLKGAKKASKKKP